ESNLTWLPLSVYLAGTVALFTLYMYLNFSGYMDIVIGCGTLLGMSLPENFNKPFSASNFLDFWSRWHITLSQWFKTYVFNPLLKSLKYKWGGRSYSNYLASISFFATFLLMGLWHGTTLVFLFYGFFLGFGTSFNKFYQVALTGFFGKERYAQLSDGPLYKILCQSLTVGYFSLSMICLVAGKGLFFDGLKHLGAPGFICALLVISLCAFVTLSLSSSPLFRWGKSLAPESIKPSVWRQNTWLALKLLVYLSLVFYELSSAPEFVYQGY
ncbi:MAG: hypothetical protein LHV69_11060, partial [Elusimicrobia bacterium]|nr:hypothetical protein [Candidatus Obscuribacterium magneticum]